MIKIAGYVIDAAISEEESLEADVTEYPVESGAVISDHVRNRPRTLELEFKVSDTPIGAAASARANGVVPSSEARQTLEALRATRQPFAVVTVTRTYERMVFTSLRFPRDAETGDALVGRATLQQIEIADVRRVSVALAKKALGHRPARNVEDAPEGWLCPIGVGAAKNKAENLRNGCRVVVTRTFGDESYLAFADTGTALTEQEIGRLESQKISTALGIKDPIDRSAVWDPYNKRWTVAPSRPVTKATTRSTAFRIMTGVDESYQPPFRATETTPTSGSSDYYRNPFDR